MPVVVDKSTGKDISVSSAELPELIRNKRISFKGPDQYLRGPNGELKRYNISTDPNFLKLLETGDFTSPEDVEVKAHIAKKEAEGFVGGAEAAALGAASGLSFGTIPYALSKTGAVPAERQKALKEAHPVLSGIGEIGATIGPLLGPKLLAKGASKIATEFSEEAVKKMTAPKLASSIKTLVRSSGTLVRGADEVAQAAGRRLAAATIAKSILKPGGVGAAATKAATMGAVESSLYATGELIHESALGDRELTAEGLMSSIGPASLIGALTFGAGGAAFHGLSKATSAVGSRIAKKVGLESEDIAAAELSKSQVSTIKALDLLTPQTTTAFKGDTRRLKQALDDVLKMDHPDGSPIIGLTSSRTSNGNRLLQTREHYSEKLNSVYDKLSDLNFPAGATNQELADEIAEKILKPYLKTIDEPGNIEQVRGHIAKLTRSYDELGEIGSVGDNPATAATLQNHRKYLRKVYDLPENKFREMEGTREVEKFIDGKLQELIMKAEKQGVIDSDVFDEFKDARDKFARIATLAKGVEKRLKQRAGHENTGLLDRTSVGGMGPWAAMGAVAGGGVGAGVGLAAREMAIQAAKEIRYRRHSFFAHYHADASKLAGVETESIKGVVKAAKSGVAAAKAILGETKRQAKAVAPSLTALGIAKGSEPTAKEKGKKLAEYSDAIRSQSTELPQRIAQSLDDETGESAPDITQSSIAITQKALEILTDALPPKPNDPSRFMQRPKPWQASDIDAERFLRIAEAVNNPHAEIERAASGDLNLKALQAVKSLYPSLYATAMSAMVEEMYSTTEPIDIRSRAIVGILIDGFDPTQTPDYISMLQKSAQYGEANEAAKESGAGNVTSKALDQVTKSREQMASPLDAITEEVA